jgi:hypothetical protein
LKLNRTSIKLRDGRGRDGIFLPNTMTAAQQAVLALRLRRPFFDCLLSLAVPSSFVAEFYASRTAWKEALASSEVRLQWDPDHDPDGRPLLRRALQLGLRGGILKDFGKRELLEVIDLTEFVAEQRRRLSSPDFAGLTTPSERVYIPADPAIARNLMLDCAPLWPHLPG